MFIEICWASARMAWDGAADERWLRGSCREGDALERLAWGSFALKSV